MKKILITGANGFIGSHLVEAALSKGWEVWAGVRSTSDLRYLPLDKIHRIELDLSDAAQLNVQLAAHVRAYGAWDYVVHAAGRTKAVRKSDFLSANTQATAHLLKALKQGSCKKFLYLSSFAAFGQGLRTEYGRSKRSAEVVVLGQSDIPSIVVRPVGVYGPRDTDFFQQIRLLKSGWNLQLGRSAQQTSFIYVKDLARLCLMALESDHQQKVWPVSDGAVVSTHDFSNLLIQIMGLTRVRRVVVPILLGWMYAQVAGFLGKLRRKAPLINPDKFKILRIRDWSCGATCLSKDLGFKPEYSLRQGWKETLDWYVASGWLSR